MALTQMRTIFGCDTVAFLNRKTKIPFAICKIPSKAMVASTIETIKLEKVGSFRGTVQSEAGGRSDEVSVTLSQYEPGLWFPLSGATVTSNSAEASGFVGNLIDQNGASTVSATTGIASVSIDTGFEDQILFSEWTIEVVSATTVNFYATNAPSSWCFNDKGLMNASPITVTSGATTIVTNALGNPTGVQFTGGSGAIAMTVGDTAIFETRPINTGSHSVNVGASTEVYTEFSLDIYGTHQGSGRNAHARIYKLSAPGVSASFESLKFSENEIKMTASFDANAIPLAGAVYQDAVWSWKYIDN